MGIELIIQIIGIKKHDIIHSGVIQLNIHQEKEDLVKKLSAMKNRKKQFENLLAQYPDLFAQHDNDFGHTTLVTYKIPSADENVRRILCGILEEVKMYS